MTKSLLIIGAGIEAIPAITRAKELGYFVIASDANPSAPGFKDADDKIIASTYNVKETVSAVKSYNKLVRNIDGVTCIASDVPVSVAAVAKELKLKGISLNSARLATDKLAMKECFLENQVAIPWFKEISNISDLKKIFFQSDFQLIIKPVDSRGSRGVLRLLKERDLDWAFSIAKQYSPTQRVMVEEYMPGPQVSTESIVIDGKCHTVGFSDRNYEFLDRFAPHVIENGGQLPSVLDARIQEDIFELVSKAAESLGISNGVVKGDIVVTNGKPYVIEIAARLSGGYFCSHEIPLNTGVDFVGLAILQALDEPISVEKVKPLFSKAVAQRYIFPQPGKVVKIDVPAWISKDPEVAFFELRVGLGDIVEPIYNHPARVGLVIAVGKDLPSAITKAEKVISAVQVVTEG